VKTSQLKALIRSRILQESYSRFGKKPLYLLEAPEREVIELIKLSNEPKTQSALKLIPTWPATTDSEPIKKSPAIKQAEEFLNNYKSETFRALQNLPGSHLGWIRAMSKGDPEPLPEIISMVKSYEKYKSQLKRPLSLKEFSSVGDLRQAIEELNTIEQTSDLDFGSILISGNEIVYQSRAWVIYYPLTEAGSVASATSNKIAKGGVKWCTAATKSENYFNDYSGDSNIHLYYCIKRGGNTLQPDGAADKTCIGVTKEESGEAKILTGVNATVNSQNKDLSKTELANIFGQEWPVIENTVLADAKGKKVTSYNSMLQNMTVVNYKEQVQHLLAQGKSESDIIDLQEKLIENSYTSQAVLAYLTEEFLSQKWMRKQEQGLFIGRICRNTNTPQAAFKNIIKALKTNQEFVRNISMSSDRDSLLQEIANNKFASTEVLSFVLQLYRDLFKLENLEDLYSKGGRNSDHVFVISRLMSNPNAPQWAIDEAIETILQRENEKQRVFDSDFFANLSENPNISKEQLSRLMYVEDKGQPGLINAFLEHDNIDEDIAFIAIKKGKLSHNTLLQVVNKPEILSPQAALYLTENLYHPNMIYAMFKNIKKYNSDFKIENDQILAAINLNKNLNEDQQDSLVMDLDRFFKFL